MEKEIRLNVETTTAKIILSDSFVDNLKKLFSGCNINFLILAGFRRVEKNKFVEVAGNEILGKLPASLGKVITQEKFFCVKNMKR